MVKQVLKTVYELDEIKEKAIEKNRYINVDCDWSCFLIDDWQDKLEKIGFINSKIYFSGFYSQGDGCCFDGDIDVEKLLNHLLNNFDLTIDEKAKLSKLQDDFNITIEKTSFSNLYCHEKTRYINIDDFYVENQDDKILINKLENLIENLRLKLCCNIYDDLEKDYEYLTSDDCVYDTLQANEYYFEKNGDIANV
jgi:hypothetical protein